MRAIVSQIVDHGTVQPAWIGIQTQDLTPELAFHFGVEPGAGVVVSNVEAESPAAKAGITRGAVITRVRAEKVRSSSDFAARTTGLAVGEALEVTFSAPGAREHSVTLEVAALPSERIDAFVWSALGVAVTDGKRSNAPMVARVREGSPAARVGLVAGDAIVAVGGNEVATPEEFRRRFAGLRNKNSVLLTVGRGRRLYRVTIPLDRRACEPLKRPVCFVLRLDSERSALSFESSAADEAAERRQTYDTCVLGAVSRVGPVRSRGRRSLPDATRLRGLKPLGRIDLAADLAADKDGYIFRFDLPGVPKDSITINVEDHVLTVSAERSESLRRRRVEDGVSSRGLVRQARALVPASGRRRGRQGHCQLQRRRARSAHRARRSGTAAPHSRSTVS